MKTKLDVIVFIRLSSTGEVTFAQAHSQGVDYCPLDHALSNGIHRLTFQIEGEQDKTPTVQVWALDGVGTGERLGG